MIKLIKILTIVTLLIFTGCEEKPIGVVTQDSNHIVMKNIDPRLKAYPEAVEWYKDADVDKVSAYNLGVLYHTKIKDFDEAIVWFKQAYNKGYLESLNNIGTVYHDLKDYDSALNWYLKAISQNIISSYYNLGHLYQSKLKDYDNAIKYYKIAIEREFRG